LALPSASHRWHVHGMPCSASTDPRRDRASIRRSRGIPRGTTSRRTRPWRPFRMPRAAGTSRGSPGTCCNCVWFQHTPQVWPPSAGRANTVPRSPHNESTADASTSMTAHTCAPTPQIFPRHGVRVPDFNGRGHALTIHHADVNHEWSIGASTWARKRAAAKRETRCRPGVCIRRTEGQSATC